ncbi:hypothetical protein [Sneathiella sp.]|uniref:hypothetical protein n=1 Tax=Sneathiella sp. TaxID=1964365 RepID=UPI0026324BE8|nr:hypothetical protein [Sneathiella sp.]MDF2366328.1 hypothetical protein [Sneathiella sp.]
MRLSNSYSFYLVLFTALYWLPSAAAQSSTVTLADLVAACKVDARPATGQFVCDDSVGAVGDAIESTCITIRMTGKINCDATGLYAETLAEFMTSCKWADDPVFKDRLGNPMKGKGIECS